MSSPVAPTPSGRTSLPVISRYSASLSKSQTEKLRAIADHLKANEPALVSTSVFGRHVECGLTDGPALLIGDSREIALASHEASERYEYRMAVLGADSDILLVGGSRSAEFERYLKNILGLGNLEVVSLQGIGRIGSEPLTTRCATHPQLAEHITARARAAGAFTIIPYIGMGSVWVLASEIAERSGVQVRVASPLPKLTRRVNNKIWFTRRVDEVLGAQAYPAFRSVYGPTALAGSVSQLAKQADRVVIKVPDSAGSVGNISIRTSGVKGLSVSQLRAYLLRTLGAIGWTGDFPLLVEVWDSPVLTSPSVQTWIPDRSQGPPILEGIYEQVVTGVAGKFVGSVPAALTDHLMEQLVAEAFQLATLFQYLGYFGRCSFDAVVAGDDDARASIHWLECNGRWGGVSIPMTLAGRLTEHTHEKAMVVVQQTQLDFRQVSIDQAQVLIGRDLLWREQSEEGVVILSPLGLERGNGINVMALADTIERAKMMAEESTQRLTAKTK